MIVNGAAPREARHAAANVLPLLFALDADDPAKP